MQFPQLIIRDRVIPVPIIQGGMGIGISTSTLCGAVARSGGCGVLSSAGLHVVLEKKYHIKTDPFTAAVHEIERARERSHGNGAIGMNIMVYLDRDFAQSVAGTIAAGADMIVCGAGLPLALPKLAHNADIALVPIVSSVRALKLICKRWGQQSRRPDAVIVEGPLAGGHLGFHYDDITKPEMRLEAIFPPIKDFAQKNGDFPVIVAGGIFDHTDICTWIFTHGADGVQMGTRFLATHESGATASYKNAVVTCAQDDIIVMHNTHRAPGSPSGMPFRSIIKTPMLRTAHKRIPRCTYGFVAQKDRSGHHTQCCAKTQPQNNFCICSGLLASCGAITNEDPLYTVGTNAARITEIVSTETLMRELTHK